MRNRISELWLVSAVTGLWRAVGTGIHIWLVSKMLQPKPVRKIVR